MKPRFRLIRRGIRGGAFYCVGAHTGTRINAIEMHRITWPQMHGFIRNPVGSLWGNPSIWDAQSDSGMMQEEIPSYRMHGFADHYVLG
jgi:hypothetical protein